MNKRVAALLLETLRNDPFLRENAAVLAKKLAHDRLLMEMYTVYTKLQTEDERKGMARAIRIFAGLEPESENNETMNDEVG